MQNMGVRWPGASCAITPVVFGLEVDHSMGLHVADGGVLADLLERPVGHHGTVGRQPLGALALGIAHLRVQGHHQQRGIVARRSGRAHTWFEVDRRHLFAASAGEHGPSLDADVGDLGAAGIAMPHDRPDGERADQSGCRSVHGIVECQSGVDAANTVDEGDAVDAVVGTFDRVPIVGLDRRVDGAFGGGEVVALIERGSVVGVPPLDEDTRHAPYRTRGPRQVRVAVSPD